MGSSRDGCIFVTGAAGETSWRTTATGTAVDDAASPSLKPKIKTIHDPRIRLEKSIDRSFEVLRSIERYHSIFLMLFLGPSIVRLANWLNLLEMLKIL